MFLEDNTWKLKVTINLIAPAKQIYKKEMLLLYKISENEINLNNSDTRGRGGGGGGSNTIADYYAEASLQIKPSESLNVCE